MEGIFEKDWKSSEPVLDDTKLGSALAIPGKKVAKQVAKEIAIKPVVEEVLEKVIDTKDPPAFEPDEVTQTVRDAFREEVEDAVEDALKEAVVSVAQEGASPEIHKRKQVAAPEGVGMPGYSRSCRRFIILATMFTVATVPVLTAQGALSSSDQKVLARFSKDARNYVDKEHSLSASKMKPTTDVAKLEDQRRQLRDATQQSRLNAKQGDLFTPATAQVFRGILRNLLSGPGGAKIKVSLNHAEPSAPAAFKGNGTFPNQDGAAYSVGAGYGA